MATKRHKLPLVTLQWKFVIIIIIIIKEAGKNEI